MLDHAQPHNGLATAAADIAETVADRAASAEAARRLDPDVVKAVVSAGFARHFVPARHGGKAGTFVELSAAVATLGESCPATAWSASLFANLARMAAFLPAAGFAEIWADGPDAVVVGSLIPVGRAEAVDGGWRLSGTWPYVSAVDYADWVLLCGMVPTERTPQARMFAVPRSACEIIHDWSSIGMQATGSNTVIVKDVFVPAARSFDRGDLFTGRAVDSTAACHSVPLQAANGLSFVTPALGAARGALASWTAYVSEKVRVGRQPGRPIVSPTPFELVLAESSTDIDAAGMLLARASAVADRGAAVTKEETARNLRDCAVVVRRLTDAVDRLFRAAGTTGQSTASPIQRFWRDVNAASTHVALQLEPAASAYADHYLRD
ncbi:acyl-CoA dehydrogenase family protein [Streptomyces sp. NPDC012693]|uniref:acyl-CoA dehydrogenase family protein n=1 Tax=Streptomyces sp. NPDC012693 TaxID=3364844 RepID=UPI00368FE21A